jgi:hypothetical protein
VADELDLKIHLASMELRERWDQLRPRIEGQLAALGKHLHELRDELAHELIGGQCCGDAGTDRDAATRPNHVAP